MVVYVMEFLNSKFPFFSTLTKFQQCMFKTTHRILTSRNDLTKISNSKYLYMVVRCALIKYENGKAKLAHYLIQIVDFDDPIDR